MTNTRTARKVVVSRVDNFTGPRLTRVTWSASVEWTDGTSTACTHDQHKTTAAAAACGKKLANHGPTLKQAEKMAVNAVAHRRLVARNAAYGVKMAPKIAEWTQRSEALENDLRSFGLAHLIREV